MIESEAEHLSEMAKQSPALFLFLAVGAIALFTFLTFAARIRARQTERTESYKAEIMKHIAELGGERNPALEYLREQQRIAAAGRLGGYKLAGLVNIGVGLGMMLSMNSFIRESSAYLAGTIPLFIGLALLAYAFWLAPERRL